MAASTSLAACLINISEGRQIEVKLRFDTYVSLKVHVYVENESYFSSNYEGTLIRQNMWFSHNLSLFKTIWSVVRAACRALENPLHKGAPDNTEGHHLGKAVVLNTFVDKEYNRSVVTLAGHLPALEEAVVAAAKVWFWFWFDFYVDLMPRCGRWDLFWCGCCSGGGRQNPSRRTQGRTSKAGLSFVLNLENP